MTNAEHDNADPVAPTMTTAGRGTTSAQDAQIAFVERLDRTVTALEAAAVALARAQEEAATAARDSALAQLAAAEAQRQAAAQAAHPAPPAPDALDSTRNITEALGFLKDWVTALVTLETALVGALAVYLQTANFGALSPAQKFLIVVTIGAFMVSIFGGGNVLYMLPGAAQRTPPASQDIFSIHTIGRQTIGFWARLHWPSFVLGGLSFGAFLVARATSS